MAFHFDPKVFDPERTCTDLEAYRPRLDSERHLANLQTVIDHARGEVERDLAVYATQMRNMVLWNMDDRAKAHGEDTYTWRCPQDWVKLAPGDIPQPYLDYMDEIGLEVPGL